MNRRWIFAVAIAAVLIASCDLFAPREYVCEGSCDKGDAGEASSDAGADAGPSFSVVNWNLEWFGDTTPGHGPGNDAVQQANVRSVLGAIGADVYGLQEVVDDGVFAALVAGLSGYAGFVADDAQVTGGAAGYSVDEQKPAFLYRTSAVTVLGARVVAAMNDYDFAFRPPLIVDARISRDGATADVTFIVLHLKATSGTTQFSDWERRANSSQELKAWLDANLPSARVVVIGDWNDDLDTSTATDGGRPLPSPFKNFVDDPAHYTFVTRVLTDEGRRTTVGFASTIDHQLASNEAAITHVPGSTRVVHPDTEPPLIPSYGSSTSDHYPVMSRFSLGE